MVHPMTTNAAMRAPAIITAPIRGRPEQGGNLAARSEGSPPPSWGERTRHGL